MEILKFRTDITEAEDKIALHLNEITEIGKWQVDTETEGNILSISGYNLDPQKVINALAEAGFKAELLRVAGIGGGDL